MRLRVAYGELKDRNMFNFEKLEIWQKAINFADLIYNETQAFPSEERFGLMNQLRRAAVSISSNIAEVSSRSSKTDFARFTGIAAGSVFEVVSQAFIARRQSFWNEDRFLKIYDDAEELSRVLSGLRKSLLSTLNSQL
jgi:four helix bundle protein